MTIESRLNAPGPKKILTLDGGGIRGALTLGVLSSVEQNIRDQSGSEETLLCDYFDLIAGTSTGAIIAAALAKGTSVAEVTEKYLQLGEKVFRPLSRLNPLNWLKSRFDHQALRDELDGIFGTMTLGSDELKTGLCIVTYRVDTDSMWVNVNHPGDKFFSQKQGMLLSSAIRASTAAPTYFEPEIIDVGHGELGVFVDGGMSTANNPSLQAFLTATLKGAAFQWSIGKDNLFLVSVGTGSWRERSPLRAVFNRRHHFWGKKVPGMLMNDASRLNQLLLQIMADCPAPDSINRQVQAAAGDLCGDSPLLTYVRYDPKLEANGLNSLGLSEHTGNLDSLRDMSHAKNKDILKEIGRRFGRQQVSIEHFPEAFIKNRSKSSVQPAGAGCPLCFESLGQKFPSRAFPDRPFIGLFGNHQNNWRDCVTSRLIDRGVAPEAIHDSTDPGWSVVDDESGDSLQEWIDELVRRQHEAMRAARCLIFLIDSRKREWSSDLDDDEVPRPSDDVAATQFATRCELGWLAGIGQKAFVWIPNDLQGRNYIRAVMKMYDNLVPVESLQDASAKAAEVLLDH